MFPYESNDESRDVGSRAHEKIHSLWFGPVQPGARTGILQALHAPSPLYPLCTRPLTSLRLVLFKRVGVESERNGTCGANIRICILGVRNTNGPSLICILEQVNNVSISTLKIMLLVQNGEQDIESQVLRASSPKSIRSSVLCYRNGQISCLLLTAVALC